MARRAELAWTLWPSNCPPSRWSDRAILESCNRSPVRQRPACFPSHCPQFSVGLIAQRWSRRPEVNSCDCSCGVLDSCDCGFVSKSFRGYRSGVYVLLVTHRRPRWPTVLDSCYCSLVRQRVHGHRPRLYALLVTQGRSWRPVFLNSWRWSFFRQCPGFFDWQYPSFYVQPSIASVFFMRGACGSLLARTVMNRCALYGTAIYFINPYHDAEAYTHASALRWLSALRWHCGDVVKLATAN